VKIAAWTRNKVAHRDVVEPESIHQFSEHYEAHRETLDCDIAGWNWPRCGQTMTLTIGPSGGAISNKSAGGAANRACKVAVELTCFRAPALPV
jgi:hypothetical protein